MCNFFKENEETVNALAASLNKQFLYHIESSIQQSGNVAGAEIVENFRVAPSIKKVCDLTV